MKFKNAVSDFRDDIVAATSLSNDDVRTEGGDPEVDPPEVILSWRATRLVNYNGANNLGGYVTSGGDQTGWEFHQYYRVEVECLVRSYKEEERDDLCTTIQETFSPNEFDASLFHDDTAEWEVGSVEPRTNPIVEPDWYQTAVPVEFTLVQKSTKSGDTLDTINQEGTNDYIDVSLEDGDVSIG